MKKLRALPALLIFALALPFVARAQTPALQYVPVVNTYAGGATASTLCSNATDTLGDGCVATSAILSGPTTGDTDAAGNFYFPDAGNNVVRRIDAVTGVITLVAGEVGSTATCSSATDSIGDGCLATQAPLNNPRAVHIDHGGNVVIADTTNQVIRRIDHTTGVISLLLGSPTFKAAREAPKNSAPLTPLTVSLDNPYNLMFDPAGNMIVLNSTGDCALLAVAINGIVDPTNSKVYDLAGTCAASASAAADGNGGLAIAATFTTSRGLALDAAENVFIGDYGDDQVREVTSPGANGQVTVAALDTAIITDVVGTGAAGTTGNGGLGTAAETASPQGLGFDNAGLLYIEQYTSGNDYVRIVNPMTDIVNAYGGTGAASFTGDNGPTATATFFTPTGIKINLGGRLTIVDESNNRLRNSSPFPYFIGTAAGSTTAAQNVVAQASATVTPASINLSNTEFTTGALSGCTLGKALAVNAYCTIPVTFSPAGPGLRTARLQLVDANAKVYNDNVEGLGLAPAAAFLEAPITTIAGNGMAGGTGNQGAATAALVNAPRGGALDSAGNFFFADSGNNVVREISRQGTMSIVAGTGTAGSIGDGSAALAAELAAPTGVALDPAGNLYIADAGNNKIREVSANTSVISTIAGTGTAAYLGDTGLATLAAFNNPSAIAIDNAGVLYVADTGNNALRAFVPGGVIVTLAGTGTAGFSGDGGEAQLAQLKAPAGVAVDLSGNIYIADTGNSVVRKLAPITTGIINFQGTISTFAGTAGAGANSGDGGLATSAGLLTPGDVGVDAAGDVYIAAGGQVRLVTTDGSIRTIAGTGASGSYSGESGSATLAVLPSPAKNLTVDPVGNVYLSDTAGNRIVSIAGSSAATVVFGNEALGATSIPQIVTLYNSGNQTLSLSNITVPAGFALSGSSANACANTTTLTPGETCTVIVTFTPTAVASYTGAITITDNALNNASSTQTINLTGTGVDHLNATSTTVTYSPTNPTYGQTVTVTATVSGGTNMQGNVNFVINSNTTFPVPLTNGQAVYQLSGLPAETISVVADYAGDSVNGSSSGHVSLTVAPAVLTVTANNVSRFPTQANPAFSYTIAGFVYNDTAASATTGLPALTTTAVTSSPAGTYPITAAQGTLSASNYTFVFVPGTLTVTSSTFTLSVAPTSLTIPAGQVGTATVTVTPTPGYSGTVMLSCSQLLANALCTFNSTSVAVDSSGPVTMQLTISTDNFQHISSLRHNSTTLAFGFLPLSALWLFGWRRGRAFGKLLPLLLLTLVVGGLAGCTPAVEQAVASSGTLTITGTDTTAKLSATTTLALNIQ